MALMRRKVKRAEERLNALHRQLGRWAKRHPVIVGTKLDFQSGWYTSYIRQTEPLPASFALYVGESLYHGRSVLEHLVWALVKANKKTPGKQHEFPIRPAPPATKPGESKRDAFIRVESANKLAGVHPDAVALIESLQPYNRRHRPPYFLTILNKMAREDRHHALHPVLIGMADPRNMAAPRLDLPTGVTVTAWEPLFKPGDRLKPDTKLVRFRISRYRRQPEVPMKTDLPVDVAFGKRRPLRFDAFRTINRNLTELLGLFEEFL